MGMNEPAAAPAVHRAAAILSFLAFRESATPTTLAFELGMAKSSMSDVLGTMLAEGLVQRRDDSFVIGPVFADLARGFVGETDVMDRFAIAWQRQSLLSEHTVSVQAIVGTRSLCTEVRHGAHLLPFTPLPGLRTELWHGAEGEPALRCLSARQIRLAMSAFDALSPVDGRDVAEARSSWIDHHAVGGQHVPLVALTGNLELNAALTRKDALPPAVLTLHLPPHREGDVSVELRTAFQDFAAQLAG